MPTIELEKMLALLRSATTSNAEFRKGQVEAIQAILNPPYRALVVQATGWGKSMVYFIATRILREKGRGPTLIISPLLSLMRNQQEAAERLGLRAKYWTSENEHEWPQLTEELARDEVDLLLVSPERLSNDDFSTVLSETALRNVGLIVVDEAHCISDWGHDFRPDYQQIGRLIRNLPSTTSIIATTATANKRVVQDITDQIGQGVKVLRGPLARRGLKIQALPKWSGAQRLAWLADHLEDLPESGIIYVLTIREANRVTEWLRYCGYEVKAYSGQLAKDPVSGADRASLEQDLLNNKVKALVSTVALGMGFDKPDLGFVVHFQSPGNLVAYYQQIGRAGRAVSSALAILMLGEEDEQIIEYFIEHARPDENEIQKVLSALSEGALTRTEISRRENMTENRVDAVASCLKAIDPSPIAKIGTKYQLTPVPYQPDLEKLEALRRMRHEERARLVAFAQTSGCFMKLLRQELDDPAFSDCGECSNCTSKSLVPIDAKPSTLRRALEFVNRSVHNIEPRKQWKADAFESYGWKGNIQPSLMCAQGRCLSYFGELGLGMVAQSGKKSNHFGDELLDRAIEVLSESDLGQFDAIVPVPSSGSKTSVLDFAQRLAIRLKVPLKDVVYVARQTAPQKEQRSAFHKAKNLDGKFEVRTDVDGRILLVDDMVDSRWTFTVIGALLRKHGAAEVVPFALSNTYGQSDDD